MVICFLKFLSSSLFLCFYLDILFPLSPLSISCSIFIPPPASSLQCWALSCSVSRNYRGWIALISLYFAWVHHGDLLLDCSKTLAHLTCCFSVGIQCFSLNTCVIWDSIFLGHFIFSDFISLLLPSEMLVLEVGGGCLSQTCTLGLEGILFLLYIGF